MIKDLKELEALLKLCRKQGVNEVVIEGISIKFGDMPKKAAKDKGQDEDDEPTEMGLTPEQLMFYSVGGAPP